MEYDFQPLFNGNDLSGWKVIGPECWSAAEGVLRCTGEGGGWVHTEKQYADFDLRLEYKISPEGNSGVFFRAPDEGEPWRSGFEVQILDDYGDEPDTHTAGAIYDILAPSKNASKPAGEWNQEEVICRGRQLMVILNGERVIDVNLDSDARLKERAGSGYLGVQNHGNLVEFRNIRVRPL